MKRYWVLTADHCVSNNRQIGGPPADLNNLFITASWSDLTTKPARFVRYFNKHHVIALIQLGADNFGPANVQLFYPQQLETDVIVTKYGRGTTLMRLRQAAS